MKKKILAPLVLGSFLVFSPMQEAKSASSIPAILAQTFEIITQAGKQIASDTSLSWLENALANFNTQVSLHKGQIGKILTDHMGDGYAKDTINGAIDNCLSDLYAGFSFEIPMPNLSICGQDLMTGIKHFIKLQQEQWNQAKMSEIVVEETQVDHENTQGGTGAGVEKDKSESKELNKTTETAKNVATEQRQTPNKHLTKTSTKIANKKTKGVYGVKDTGTQNQVNKLSKTGGASSTFIDQSEQSKYQKELLIKEKEVFVNRLLYSFDNLFQPIELIDENGTVTYSKDMYINGKDAGYIYTQNNYVLVPELTKIVQPDVNGSQASGKEYPYVQYRVESAVSYNGEQAKKDFVQQKTAVEQAINPNRKSTEVTEGSVLNYLTQATNVMRYTNLNAMAISGEDGGGESQKKKSTEDLLLGLIRMQFLQIGQYQSGQTASMRIDIENSRIQHETLMNIENSMNLNNALLMELIDALKKKQ